MSALLLYGVARVKKTLVLPHDAVAHGVRLITQGGIAAIAGEAPFTSAGGLSRGAAVSHLLIQQRTLEAVMAQGPVLPVRFGSVAPGEAAVRFMLARGEKRLVAKLDEFSDCVQAEVAVSWDLDAIFSDIGREAHVHLAGQSAAGQTSEDVRLRVGALVKASLDRRRRDIAAQILDELMTVATDVIENAPSGDEQVASFTLLLDKADLASLEGVLNRMDGDFAGRLEFRCIGPAPLSTFAVVDIDFRPSFAARSAWTTGEASGPGHVPFMCEGEAPDVFVNVVRREPAFFGPSAPLWRGKETAL